MPVALMPRLGPMKLKTALIPRLGPMEQATMEQATMVLGRTPTTEVRATMVLGRTPTLMLLATAVTPPTSETTRAIPRTMQATIRMPLVPTPPTTKMTMPMV